MLKTSVSYVDFNGQTASETLYLHMSRMEMLKFLSRHGIEPSDDLEKSFTKLANDLAAKKDVFTMLSIIDDFILSSYGEKSADGKRFVKTDEVRNKFDESLAHEALINKFLDDPTFIQNSTAQIIQAAPVKNTPKKPTDFKRAQNRHNKRGKQTLDINAAKNLVKDSKFNPNA